MKDGRSLIDFILDKTGIEDEDDITLEYKPGGGILIYGDDKDKPIG